MSINRRNFLKKTTLSTAAIAASTVFTNCESEVKLQASSGGVYMGNHAAPKLNNIRAAFIGVGSRGGEHLEFFAGLPGTEVDAISDLYEDNVKQKLDIIKHVSGASYDTQVATYWGDENKWKVMLQASKL